MPQETQVEAGQTPQRRDGVEGSDQPGNQLRSRLVKRGSGLKVSHTNVTRNVIPSAFSLIRADEPGLKSSLVSVEALRPSSGITATVS